MSPRLLTRSGVNLALGIVSRICALSRREVEQTTPRCYQWANRRPLGESEAHHISEFLCSLLAFGTPNVLDEPIAELQRPKDRGLPGLPSFYFRGETETF